MVVQRVSKAKGLRLLTGRCQDSRCRASSQLTAVGDCLGAQLRISWKSWGVPALDPTDLLPIVGGVREQGGDMEHDLIVLVRRVQGVGSRGIS